MLEREISHESLYEDPETLLGHTVERLLYTWQELPESRLQYEDAVRFTAEENNKYRKAWFNAIAQVASQLSDADIHPEVAHDIFTDAQILNEEVAGAEDRVQPRHVAEGNRILQEIRRVLQHKGTTPTM